MRNSDFIHEYETVINLMPKKTFAGLKSCWISVFDWVYHFQSVSNTVVTMTPKNACKGEKMLWKCYVFQCLQIRLHIYAGEWQKAVYKTSRLPEVCLQFAIARTLWYHFVAQQSTAATATSLASVRMCAPNSRRDSLQPSPRRPIDDRTTVVRQIYCIADEASRRMHRTQ